MQFAYRSDALLLVVCCVCALRTSCSVSKSIVELHGGQVSYTSVVGEGADFHFSLPMDVMLVRTGKGDSSSFGGTSHTHARSEQSQMSDKRLETIVGSPDLVGRQLSHPSTPDTHSLVAPQQKPTSQGHELAVTPDPTGAGTTVQHVDDECTVVFHDEVDPEARPLIARDPSASPPGQTPNSGVPPIHPAPPLHPSPLCGPLQDKVSSSGGGSGSFDISSSFYGGSRSTHSSQSRSRSRGLRGANLGVTIPSSTSNTVHAAAQNLTASVKTAGGTAAGGGGGGSSGASSVTSANASASATVVTTATNHAVSNAHSSPLSLQGVRVLVVEDSHPNRKLLMSLLTHMGCHAAGVENGQECIDLFKVRKRGERARVRDRVSSREGEGGSAHHKAWKLHFRCPSFFLLFVFQDVMTSSPSSKTQHLMQLGPISPATQHMLAAANLAAGQLDAHAGNPMAHCPFDIILMDGSMRQCTLHTHAPSNQRTCLLRGFLVWIRFLNRLLPSCAARPLSLSLSLSPSVSLSLSLSLSPVQPS
jgi:CheY-like chemotaxis protein